MMYGCYGCASKNAPFMKNGKCSKLFLNIFNDHTIVNEEGYLVYCTRDNRQIMDINGVNLDNRFIIPYNCKLLVIYYAYINVEWCNQSTSTKYLFKYVNKGHDHVTTTFGDQAKNDGKVQNVDEIKAYYNYRYISYVRQFGGLLDLIFSIKIPWLKGCYSTYLVNILLSTIMMI